MAKPNAKTTKAGAKKAGSGIFKGVGKELLGIGAYAVNEARQSVGIPPMTPSARTKVGMKGRPVYVLVEAKR